MYDKAYQNLDIRKALSMAINRQEIVDKIFQGAYTPAASFVSPIVQGARDNTCGDACKFDPAAAKTLYARAGGLPGNKVDLYYNADGGHKEWVDAVCNQIAKNLSVTCTGQPVAQLSDIRKQARAHTLNAPLRGAWAFDYPSMEDYLTPLFVTKASSNDSAYSNSAFDAKMQEADTAADEATAIKGYQAAEDIIARDLPVIPMWFKQNIYGFSTDMKTVNVDLFANVDVLSLEKN
jgi:oligopeptide transport system substrate-binding protein